jgi:hypothetical protein
MENRMNRSIVICALIVASAAFLPAQQSDPYEGTSSPPSNDTIVTPAPVAAAAPAPAKPSPAQPMVQASQPVQAQALSQQQCPQPQPSAVSSGDGTDDGIVQVASDQPVLNKRSAAYDPDSDIVHPAPLGPNELGSGTTIRVRLLQRISTVDNQDGETFRTRVASDVLQGGQVLIPAGSEIDGHIRNVSSGSLGGHGSMRLQPETVILPDGARYRMYAQVTGTPGSNTRVGSEGAIEPGSRLKRDGIEYGGAVGAGAIAGAAWGGPAGALAGTLIGAGVITTHLLVSHPQATLDEGTVLLFTLSEPLNLVPAGSNGN